MEALRRWIKMVYTIGKVGNTVKGLLNCSRMIILEACDVLTQDILTQAEIVGNI